MQNIEARRKDIFKNLTADAKVKKSSISSRLKSFFGIDWNWAFIAERTWYRLKFIHLLINLFENQSKIECIY